MSGSHGVGKWVWSGLLVIALAAATWTLIEVPSARAEMGGGHGGGHDGHGGGGKDGDHGKGGGQGAGGHGMGMHLLQLPGTVQQECSPLGGMPPHFCEPIYKVVSSVRGVQVANVTPAGDRALMVTLRELNSLSPGVAQKLVIVGGSGDLAGSTVVPGGWKQTVSVQVNLEGTESIYERQHLHLHLFPLTGE